MVNGGRRLKLWPFKNWEDLKIHLRSMKVGHKLVLYLLLTLVIYGSTIVVDNTVMVNLIDQEIFHPDVHVYRERAQAILDGKLLYRDLPGVESPPLINYILVPPQVLGGAEHDWVWAAYFSFFAFLMSALIYLALRRYDDVGAFLAGAVVLVSPYTIIESGTGEDESIAATFFILAVILMFMKRREASTAAIGLGIWVKMFSILLFPVHFLQQSNWKDRAMTVGVLALITAVVIAPFAILAWEDFINFPSYYFLAQSTPPNGGSSIWQFLRMGGVSLPSVLQLGILGVAMAAAYLYPYYKKMPAWQSSIVMLLTFFTFYPKVHGGYWIMLVALLSVWAANDRRIFLRITLSFVPFILATALAEGDGTAAPIEFYGSWFVGFLLALLGLLMFVDAARIAFGKRSFIEMETLGQVDPSE